VRIPFAAFILACVVAAGCVGPAASPPLHGVPARLPGDGTILRSVHKDVGLAYGVTLGGAKDPQHAFVDSGASPALVLEVGPQAGLLLVELVQHAGTGRVLLHAIPPSAADRTPLLVDSRTLYSEQAPDGTARLRIVDPLPGKWAFDVHADGVAKGFAGTIYATTLAGPIDGFTAVPR
jgi:hypothetical protein